MNKQEWIRKYTDTHTELSVIEKLSSTNSIKKHPSDLNAKHVKKIKAPYEAQGLVKQKQNITDMLEDAVHVRAEELLDPSSLPMDKLLTAVTKFKPPTQEITASANTFAELIIQAHNKGKDERIQKADTIDVRPEDC